MDNDNGLLFIFEVKPDGSQVLVHTETPTHLLSYDELLAWFTSWKSQLGCGEFQFDYVTYPGILEAFHNDETLSQTELHDWQALKVGDTAPRPLSGTIWNDHLTTEVVCAAPPTPQPVPTQAISIAAVTPAPPALVPLPEVTTTTTSTAPPPPTPIGAKGELAVTGGHEGVLILLGVSLAALGIACKNAKNFLLTR